MILYCIASARLGCWLYGGCCRFLGFGLVCLVTVRIGYWIASGLVYWCLAVRVAWYAVNSVELKYCVLLCMFVIVVLCCL